MQALACTSNHDNSKGRSLVMSAKVSSAHDLYWMCVCELWMCVCELWMCVCELWMCVCELDWEGGMIKGTF